MEVYDHPSDTFVGGFIGSPPMNFLDGVVEDGRVVFGKGASIPAPGHAQPGKVRLGIRAEAIEVDGSGGDGTRPDTVGGTVDVVEPLGSSTLLTVDVAGQIVKIQVPPTQRVHSGDAVQLYLGPAAVRLYDPETGLGLVAA
jgi:multiple sugar transport system ATP-binding protein